MAAGMGCKPGSDARVMSLMAQSATAMAVRFASLHVSHVRMSFRTYVPATCEQQQVAEAGWQAIEY